MAVLKRCLVTGARSTAALELVRALSRLGVEVHAADSFPGSLCRASNAISSFHLLRSPRHDFSGFRSDLLRLVKEHQIELIIPTCEESFFVAKALPDLPSDVHVHCAPLEQLLQLHSKWEFIETLRALGVACPQTRLLSQQEEFSSLSPFADRIVFKPEFSRFGSQVHFRSAARWELPAIQVSPRQRWVAQEFIAGRQFCTYSVAVSGKLRAHVVYEPQFTVGTAASVYFQAVVRPEIDAWVEDVVCRLGYTGQIAFDLMDDGVRILPLECNPRATNGIHLFTGFPRFASVFLPESVPAESSLVLKPAPSVRRMLALPMLAAFWSAWPRRQALATWLNAFRRATDVCLAPGDAMPFFHQLVALWHFARLSQKFKISLLEATTFDFEWNGEEVTP